MSIEAMTSRETVMLAELEARIAKGIQTFAEVGAALAEIRDRRLYRDSHANFNSYVQDRWRMTDRYARYLIASAEVAERVPVPTERVARALSTASNDIEEVFERAKEKAGGDPTKVRVRHIEEADKDLSGIEEDGIAMERVDVGDRAVVVSNEIDGCVTELRRSRESIMRVLNGPAGMHLMGPTILGHLKSIAESIKAAKPHAVCGYCGGSGIFEDKPCNSCGGLGWVTKTTYLQQERKGRVL